MVVEGRKGLEGPAKWKEIHITCSACLTLSSVLQDLFLELSAPGFVLLLATFLEQLDRPQKVRDLVRHCLFLRAKVGTEM